MLSARPVLPVEALHEHAGTGFRRIRKFTVGATNVRAALSAAGGGGGHWHSNVAALRSTGKVTATALTRPKCRHGGVCQGATCLVSRSSHRLSGAETPRRLADPSLYPEIVVYEGASAARLR